MTRKQLIEQLSEMWDDNDLDVMVKVLDERLKITRVDNEYGRVVLRTEDFGAGEGE